jgi:hypothetical protein
VSLIGSFAMPAAIVLMGTAILCAPAESMAAPKAQSPPAQPQPTAPERPGLGIPPPKNLFIMIRTTLVALYQANITGNYSVLRDLGAPSFQQANNVQRLAAAFADLRTRGGDMAPVVIAMPTLVHSPAIDPNGMLRLTGSFDTKPNELAFDLAFQAIDGFWRLDGIAVQFRTPVAATAADDRSGQRPPEDKSAARSHAASKSPSSQKK